MVGCYYIISGKPHGVTFRDVGGAVSFIRGLPDCRLVGHNLKFDLLTLKAKGHDLTDLWAHDTLLMAAALTDKVSGDWLGWYEGKRQKLNQALPRGHSHRPASPHSLKTLAPYFLGVEPFWEDPSNHDNDEYVLKDCEYTLRLAHFLAARLKEQGSYEFYTDKLLPWTQLLLQVESKGIALDLEALEEADETAQALAEDARRALASLWADAYASYEQRQRRALFADYAAKAEAAVARLKKGDPAATRERYRKLYEKARDKLEPLNLDSPTQLSWLLKDHLGLDISTFQGDESTGKPVLQKLASEREDIRVYLEYRKQQKLTTAFFPSYREMQHNGVLHCSFNPTGTRTGRLSSSHPNLQQVPSHLHRLFRARPGFKLATFDMSAIEPRLISYYTWDVNLFDIVASGADFHGNNARIFFGLDCDVADVKEAFPQERKMAKEVGLSLFYGAGSGRLEETAQKYGFKWNRRHCQQVLERFKDAYSRVFEYRDEHVNTPLLQGHALTNLLGRQFKIDDPTDVHMQGLNTLIQGSASDLVLHSAHRMSSTFAERGLDAHVLLLVHDEIVVEVPESREDECVSIIKHAMTDYNLSTPLGRVPLLIEGKVAGRWEK